VLMYIFTSALASREVRMRSPTRPTSTDQSESPLSVNAHLFFSFFFLIQGLSRYGYYYKGQARLVIGNP